MTSHLITVAVILYLVACFYWPTLGAASVCTLLAVAFYAVIHLLVHGMMN